MYDYVIITHLPSFYKINLFNEISKKLKIYVVFIAENSKIRSNDFFDVQMHFNYTILRKNYLEHKSSVVELIRLVILIRKLKSKKIIIGGWDKIEFWILLIFNKRKSIGMILESTNVESSSIGYKGFIKRFFLSRISTVFAPGKAHAKLLMNLSYSGKILITNGVGIFNREDKQTRSRKTHSIRYLYVGRLSKEKNLGFLIKYFNENPTKQLTIVGTGPLEKELRRLSNTNISFTGYKKNTDLYESYLEHEVFILPSIGEPWGLVVDEALYYGLPVLVSNNCGCRGQLYKENQEGISFNPYDQQDMASAIEKIEKNYKYFAENVLKINFTKRDELQVMAYIKGFYENTIDS